MRYLIFISFIFLCGCANLVRNQKGELVYANSYGKSPIYDELPSLVNNEDYFNYVRHDNASGYNFTYSESPYNTVVYPKHKKKKSEDNVGVETTQ